MSPRPVMLSGTELAPHGASADSAPGHRFALDVDRPRRIDRLIDYFGTGDTPSGASPLDTGGAR